MDEPEPLWDGVTAILGRSTTFGQRLPLGTDDPVIAARAVRRALADARRRAADVTALVVATPSPLSEDAVRAFARRALGPAGERVAIEAVEASDPDAQRLASIAGSVAARRATSEGVSVAVGIDPDGTSVALCLERGPTGATGPSGPTWRALGCRDEA